MEIVIKKLLVSRDERGWLSEIVRPEDVGKTQFGQILITTANKGQTKGKHYHKRKIEWYCVIQGKAILTITNNKTKKGREVPMGEGNMILVKIPPNHFHEIKNIGETEMLLLVYINEAFDPSDPDIYYDKQVV